MVPRFGGRYSLDRLKLAVDRAGIAFTDTVTGIAFTDTVNARRPARRTHAPRSAHTVASCLTPSSSSVERRDESASGDTHAA
jgi:hypothetical protein